MNRFRASFFAWFACWNGSYAALTALIWFLKWEISNPFGSFDGRAAYLVVAAAWVGVAINDYKKNVKGSSK